MNTHQPKFELTSIRFSHYVEKVRWTMDRLGISYRERPLMPIIHFAVTPFVVGLGGESDSHSTRFSTPILKTDRGEILVKSSPIMQYLSERFLSSQETLFPNDEVAQLDEHYNCHLGPRTRELFYFNVLNQLEVIFELAERNVGQIQTRLFKTLFPLCRKWIISGLDITCQRVNQGIDCIYREFERVGKRLADGRPFLFGEQITAADISFACLGGAITLPSPTEGYGAYLPPLDSPCQELGRIAADLRQSDAGRWVLHLYRHERGKRLIPASPFLL